MQDDEYGNDIEYYGNKRQHYLWGTGGKRFRLDVIAKIFFKYSCIPKIQVSKKGRSWQKE